MLDLHSPHIKNLRNHSFNNSRVPISPKPSPHDFIELLVNFIESCKLPQNIRKIGQQLLAPSLKTNTNKMKHWQAKPYSRHGKYWNLIQLQFWNNNWVIEVIHFPGWCFVVLLRKYKKSWCMIQHPLYLYPYSITTA